MSGAAGGLLLGATTFVMLQALELLADNRLLMNQLEKYITDRYHLVKGAQVNDVQISLFAVMFGVFSSTLSLTFGVYVGLSTFALVIKKEGEAAMGKALGIAGTVCLMGVTATGYILGLTFESFLSITFSVDIVLWYIMSLAALCMYPIVVFLANSYMCVLLCGSVFTPSNAMLTYFLSFLFKMKSILGIVFIPVIVAVKIFEKSHSFKMTTAPVALMLIVSDVYNFLGQHIVSVQSPKSTNNSSVVPEAIFVGVLAPLLWTVTVGMSFFATWQRGLAGKICATAAGSGAAVLGVIEMALRVLGHGPTIGALMGVAGAVGVSFSAALAATDQYGQILGHYGFVGRLGVTVGAAVGAFLSSCAHSELLGIFMGLCAASIPAGAFLKLLIFDLTSWRSNLHSCIYLLLLAVLMSFTCTHLCISMFTTFMQFRAICILCLCITFLTIHLYFKRWHRHTYGW